MAVRVLCVRKAKAPVKEGLYMLLFSEGAGKTVN